jgi:hypothetical protein
LRLASFADQEHVFVATLLQQWISAILTSFADRRHQQEERRHFSWTNALPAQEGTFHARLWLCIGHTSDQARHLT